MEGAGGTGPCDDSLLTFVDLFTSSTVCSELQLQDVHSSTVVKSVLLLLASYKNKFCVLQPVQIDTLCNEWAFQKKFLIIKR